MICDTIFLELNNNLSTQPYSEFLNCEKEMKYFENNMFHCCLCLSRAKGMGDYHEKNWYILSRRI